MMTADVPRATVGQAIGAFLRRDLQVALSYRLPFALEIVTIAFTVFTFSLVAHLVDPGEIQGGYFSFVVVGLAIAAFLDAGVVLVGGNLRQEQVQGTLEATFSAGLPVRALAAGISAYPMISAAIGAVAYVVLGALVGARAPGANWPLAIGVTVLGSLSFAGIGLVGAALVLVFRRAAAATGFLVAVLSLAGGEFFPVRLLPGWFRLLSDLSPFTQTLRLARAAVFERASWGDSSGALAVLAVMAVAFGSLGIWVLALGLRRARRTGGLTQY